MTHRITTITTIERNKLDDQSAIITSSHNFQTV